jgi:hypothetical protein
MAQRMAVEAIVAALGCQLTRTLKSVKMVPA